VRVARLALTATERAMHERLREYASAVWRERGARSAAACLAMTVLLKRAASSAWALRRSVEHRLDLLGGSEVPPAHPVLPFPGPDDGDTDAADAAVPAALAEPGLAEPARELQWLARLAELAAVAAAGETKLTRLLTLLRRAGEPAIVFTEYRDTLEAAVRALARAGPIAVLHGGLPRLERREAERAFTTGAAHVLLATDAASEGLNLHGRCRLVINLELPWNPVRLEQRIGRVDRIGQQRRVHAIHMVGRDTAESYVLGRLVARVRTIRDAIGGDDVTGMADTELAAGALGLTSSRTPEPASMRESIRIWSPVDEGERSMCELLDRARRLTRPARSRSSRTRATRRLPLGIVGPRLRRRLSLEPGVVLGFQVDAMSAAGRPAASAVILVHVALAPAAFLAAPATLVSAVLPLARAAALDDSAHRLARDLDAHRRFTERAIARERALLEEATGGGTAAAVQAGLFDRRALDEAARQEAHRERRRQVHAARLERLALDARVDPVARAEPLVALVLR
jgi:hypothetical protein